MEISQSSAKGKYLRPLFCIALCAGLGGDSQKAIPAAARLELAHRASLVFDDIQDDGKERNGQPTVWTIWGRNHAITAGMALSSYAHLTAYRRAQQGISPEMPLRILTVLENAVIDLCQGQYIDLSISERVNGTIGDHFGERVNLTMGGMVNLTTSATSATSDHIGGRVNLTTSATSDHIGGRVNLTTSDYLVTVQGKTAALFGAAYEVGAICAGVDSGRENLAREFYAQVKCKEY